MGCEHLHLDGAQVSALTLLHSVHLPLMMDALHLPSSVESGLLKT